LNKDVLLKKVFLRTTLTASVLLNLPANALELSQHLTTIVEPTPIKRVAPIYPMSAAKNNREGWAKLSFVIGIDGQVSNVLVTETSGSADFAKAAKRAILKWQYQPALENGEPIEQCVNTVQMDFRMSDNRPKGVTRRFKGKYNSAQQALLDKDLPLVKELLDEMSNMRNRHLSENNYMHLLAANYAKEIGDENLQLFHLYRVTRVLLPDDQIFNTLNSIFMLEISLNNLRATKSTYDKLIKLEAAKPYLAHYDKIMAKIEAFVGGEQDIVRNAKMTDKDYWSASLVRNQFSLVDVKGSLHKLDVRCANKRHVYTVEENNTWKLPASWEGCHIYVYRDDNTSFNLVEHAIKS